MANHIFGQLLVRSKAPRPSWFLLANQRSFVHQERILVRCYNSITEPSQLYDHRSYIISPPSSRCCLLVTSDIIKKLNRCSNHNQIRTFKNVAEYHNKADDTLHNIQDAIEELIENNFQNGGSDDDVPEVNYANGVLTISLPPHGTWVINKQTPNEQLWWSSPISGPRRYEYVEDMERWVYSRVIGEDGGVSSGGAREDDTLGHILVEEIKKLYNVDLELEA
ncbi:hypothetical protein ACHAXN_009994 [Cyclotella atomus]